MARRFSRIDNISPGTWRGTKAKKYKGRLLPRDMMWNGRYWLSRARELNGSDFEPLKPFASKPIKRKDKRGQSKPGRR